MRRTALAAVLAALVVSLVAWSGSRRPPRPTAVILVIVDTLRADRFAAWGADRVVTPRLDRWLESAVVFEQARAPSPWTLPSFASMYTGCDPARHGSRVVDPRAEASSFVGADARLPRLAEIVSAAGWNTAGFVTNRFLSPAFGLARGFRRYDQTWRFSRDPPRANAGVDSALTWIDRVGDAPFLLVLHVFDPHLPYDPPPETLGRFSGGYGGDVRLPIDKVGRIRSGKIPLGEADRAFIRDVYDEEIAFTDEQLGRFLDGLREREIFERALVVLTSDHGEELWDHGGFEHGHTLYDELLHVPLAAWAPGVEARRVAGAVTLTDLMPTVLDAAGLPVPEGLDGVSLWPVVADRRSPPERVLVAESPLYVTARRAIIAWPWKLVVRDEEGEHELYELETDPGEERDVAAERSDVVQRLLEAAAGRDSSASLPNGPTVELDEETLESLRALGYVD